MNIKLWQRIYVILLIMLCSLYYAKAQLRINEFLAANISANFNSDFNYTDWIELYNASDNTINLDNYTISNDPLHPEKFTIWGGIVLQPREHFIVNLDKRNYIFERYIHTNFSLDPDGDFIGLYDPSGNVVDSLYFSEQIRDVSCGRLPDNEDLWGYFSTPTPGSANNTDWTFSHETAGKVKFSLGPGYYQGSVTVALSATGIADNIVYTLNGDYPKDNAQVYSEPITITESSVIRARCIADSVYPGEVSSATYFIDIEPANLPVVSLSTDNGNFYDNTYGFYVDGTNGESTDCAEIPVNWARDWERPINFEYFTQDGQEHINQLIGSQIFGGCSRAAALRSLSIYARKDYSSNKLKYSFFSDKNIAEYKCLVLRNSGSDVFASMLRDGFMQTLIKDRMDIDYMAYQPVLVYLNGSYFGLLNLREKMNEHYVENNHGVNPDSIDIIEKFDHVVIGTDYYWQGLLTFIREHDLSDSLSFEEVKTMLDVNEYMNYYIINIYYENEDWPQANVKFWREQKDIAQWRALLFDTDFGFGLFPQSGNTLAWALRSPHPSTEIMVALMQNESFKNEFIQRFAAHINTTFDPNRVLPILDSLANNIEPHIPRQVEIWELPYFTEYWEYHVKSIMVDFANNEPDRVRGWIQDYFAISGTFDLSVSVDNPKKGFVKVNEVEVDADYNGEHFNDIPVRLTAVPRQGYQFLGWTGDMVSTEPEIFMKTSENVSVLASFCQADPITGIYINEFVADNQTGITDEHGEHEDWIELYNSNSVAIDLAGLFLSDSAEYLTRYRIPFGDAEHTTIGPGGYLVFWADDDCHQGSRHLSFKLKQDGEQLFLSQVIDTQNVFIDSVSYTKHFADASFGRDTENLELWEYMFPTPGYKNKNIRLENIFINEFMASNRTVLQDNDFEFDDWIEIYNDNNFPIDIGGMFITDNLDNKIKCRIPVSDISLTTIQPKGFLILWADDSTEQGILHTNFKLNADWEQIGLVQPNGIDYVDTVTYSDIILDAPFGRDVDGYGTFGYLLATPGVSNIQHVFEGLYINEFMASNRSILMDNHNEYDDWIEIYNDNEFPVNVAGLFLSDKFDNTHLCRIPTFNSDSTWIAPQGHIIFWADDSIEQGIRHLNFKLNADGEHIVLAQTNGRDIIDSLSFSRIHTDVSFGRKSDGGPVFCYQPPTPDSANIFYEYNGIKINEIMASDHSLFMDEHNEFSDWIEVRNFNDYPVNIAGIFISDSIGEPMRSQIGFANEALTTVPAHGYLVLFADNQPEQGILHLEFKLSEQGEQVGFFGNDGSAIVDTVSYPEQFNNFSYSKFVNGKWLIVPPTPTSVNQAPEYSNLLINEIMADNTNWVQDDFSEFEDWIELVNHNNFEVNIAGMYLSDSLLNPSKYRIPSNALNETLIPPHSYKVIWLDNDSDQGALHANFKLSRNGEQIGLFNYDYNHPVDEVSFPKQPKNFSYGKLTDTDKWCQMPPTPLAPNLLPDLSGLFINEVMTSNTHTIADNSGEYDDWIELYNAGSGDVNIAGLFIADSIGDPSPDRISSEFPDSTLLHSGGFLLLWADDETEQGLLHLNFKLKREGEKLALYGYDKEIIVDSVNIIEIPTDRSFGRITDGNPYWDELVIPTPGRSNNITFSEPSEISTNDNRFEVFPNPASNSVMFRISLLQYSNLTIRIYNHVGELITVPVQNSYPEGSYDISWNLADSRGYLLPGGIYFYCIETDSNLVTGRLVICAP